MHRLADSFRTSRVVGSRDLTYRAVIDILRLVYQPSPERIVLQAYSRNLSDHTVKSIGESLPAGFMAESTYTSSPLGVLTPHRESTEDSRPTNTKPAAKPNELVLRASKIGNRSGCYARVITFPSDDTI